MSTALHNHWNCSRGCSRLPLTLADKQVISGRDTACHDGAAGGWYCGDCLADLPASGYDQLGHVCGADAGGVRVGDSVRYDGSLAGFAGTAWEVTLADARGLVLVRRRPGAVECAAGKRHRRAHR